MMESNNTNFYRIEPLESLEQEQTTQSNHIQ